MDYRPQRRTNHVISLNRSMISSVGLARVIRGISCYRFGYLGIVVQVSFSDASVIDHLCYVFFALSTAFVCLYAFDSLLVLLLPHVTCSLSITADCVTSHLTIND